MFPPGEDYYDEVIVESRGRVKAVRTRPGVVQFQDPDLRLLRHYRDGRIQPINNPFITQDAGVRRLQYDFEANRVRDSFGRFVGVANLRLPSAGRVADFQVLQARYRRMSVDPRRFTPAGNQEVIERLVLIDKEGNLIVRQTSYGLGKKYDRARRGKWWSAQVRNATGIGKDVENYYEEWQKSVVSREFIVKSLVPR